MNQFSFSEDEEPQELHSLQLEIGTQDIGNWMGKSNDNFYGEPEEPKVLSQFDINISSKEEIPEQFTKRSSHCQDVLDVLNGGDTREGEGEGEGETETIEEVSSQISGQTFYEQQTGNSTILQKTVIEQQWRRESGQALIEFSSLSNHMYLPLMDQLSLMMEEIQQFTNKTAANLDMYHMFFKIKLQQEKERCRVMAYKFQQEQKLGENQLMREIYIQERAVVDQMHRGTMDRVEVLTNFCQQIEESCSKMQILLSKTLELRNKKINHVFKHLSKTHSIYTQLLTLIEQPPNKRPIRWAGRTDMHCDRYLQRKYLQEREKLFLHLLKVAGQKVLGLVHCIFLKEEPTITSLIHKEMQRYSQLSRQTYGSCLSIELKEDEGAGMAQIEEELAGILMGMVPKEWEIPQMDKKCELVINYLNEYLQNQIFLPTVVIDPQLVLIRQEARWVPISPPEKPSQKGGSQKENIDDANQPSCSSLIGRQKKQSKFEFIKDIRKGFNVSVVLTLDKYLHLQCGQKIACLKLKKLKLKRKGEDSVLLIEKNKLSSLFSSPNLGELMFYEKGAADKFASAVLSTL